MGNRLRFRIFRILRSCKSKHQISDVVSTHNRRRRHLFSPIRHSAAAEGATARLPLLSPDVSGRKCPPASPILLSSPLNRKKKAHSPFTYKKRAFETRFSDSKYVNNDSSLFTSDGDDDEEAVVEESLAVVKRSRDPYNDFRASMVEMIVENNIFAANDLENLLRCFLCLNSYHHHKVIIQVFAEIWETFFLL